MGANYSQRCNYVGPTQRRNSKNAAHENPESRSAPRGPQSRETHFACRTIARPTHAGAAPRLNLAARRTFKPESSSG